jgi:hypothetical protein
MLFAHAARPRDYGHCQLGCPGLRRSAIGGEGSVGGAAADGSSAATAARSACTAGAAKAPARAAARASQAAPMAAKSGGPNGRSSFFRPSHLRQSAALDMASSIPGCVSVAMPAATVMRPLAAGTSNCAGRTSSRPRRNTGNPASIMACSAAVAVVSTRPCRTRMAGPSAPSAACSPVSGVVRPAHGHSACAPAAAVAWGAGPFLGGAFGVQGDHAGNDVRIARVARPAISIGGGGVEPVMQQAHDRHLPSIVDPDLPRQERMDPAMLPRWDHVRRDPRLSASRRIPGDGGADCPD